MFEELIRELRRLEGHKFAVAMPSDADGYFDRECPSTECQFRFKVHEDDWHHIVGDNRVSCPFCGHSADSDQWWTKDQIMRAKQVGFAHVQGRISRAMKRDANSWNSRQPRRSFLSITMRVDSMPRQVILPMAVAKPMRLKITCPVCACRYAVIGAAFFCPACGHNAANLVFRQSITGIRLSLDAIGTIRKTWSDLDTAETLVRIVIENGLQNAITAFQRYAEALYRHNPSLPQPRRNAFQNLNEGSTLWHDACGHQYGDYLDSVALASLARFFQQRHLLAHTQGLVDDDYVSHTGDTTHRIGQRLVVRETAVRECLDLIEKLAAGMAGDAALIKLRSENEQG